MADAERIRNLLAVIVDSVDYVGDGKSRACAPTEMIGAVLPRELLLEAKQVLAESHPWSQATSKP